MPYGMTGSNYAAGDYYRGDYYQGDPGILGTLFKGVTGAVKGLVTGGPVGAVTGAVSALVPRAQPGSALVPLPPPPTLQIPTSRTTVGPFGTIYSHETFASPGGSIPFPGGGMVGPVGPMIRGLHYNKSTYETRGGGTSRWGPAGSLQVHPKGTVLVKSRRMNVGNARALKRALRRARGFEHLARSVMIVHRFKRKATRRVGRKR